MRPSLPCRCWKTAWTSIWASTIDETRLQRALEDALSRNPRDELDFIDASPAVNAGLPLLGMNAEARQEIAEIVKQIRVCMLFTHRGGAKGPLHARPMYTYFDGDEFDGRLWFLTDINSDKADDLRSNPEAVLSYADPGRNVFLTVRGRASVLRDSAMVKKFWNIHAQAWFPQGVDDPSLGILRVDAEEAEFWEGPSKIVYALSVAKAVLTGDRPNIDTEHRKVTV